MINLYPWPFDERMTAVLTTRQVLEGEQPILCVVHDAGALGWRFLCSKAQGVEDVRFITLEEALELDLSISELADLPLGGRVRRASVMSPGFENLPLS